MQDLTEKNTHLSQELQECKAQLEAALAAAGGATETPSGNTYFKCTGCRTRSGQATSAAPAEGRREGAYEGAAGEEQTPRCQHPAGRRTKRCSGPAV